MRFKMCDTCGCNQPGNAVTFKKPSEPHYQHDHQHHEHAHEHHPAVTVNLEEDILLKNNLIAERNRGFFQARNIRTFNLVSSPGSGKTTLLEKTISHLKDRKQFIVIEGDQQTMRDAERIRDTGAPVIQVNTGTGCHLDSQMIHRAVTELNPPEDSILLIENVGNLVCPALFDLGESAKVVIISVTEGDDKPLKYPTMFAASDVCIINKTDLLPYVEFDVEACKQNALSVNHHLKFFQVSATTGEGLEAWFDWLLNEKGTAHW